MRPKPSAGNVVGMGARAENCRRQRANLAVDRKCLDGLKKLPSGSVDLFGRNLTQLEDHVRFAESALRIAESVS